MIKSIHQCWKSFETAILDPINAPPVQRNEMQKAFYGGFATALTLFDKVASVEDESTAMAIFQSFHLQVEAYALNLPSNPAESFDWKH